MPSSRENVYLIEKDLNNILVHYFVKSLYYIQKTWPQKVASLAHNAKEKSPRFYPFWSRIFIHNTMAKPKRLEICYDIALWIFNIMLDIFFREIRPRGSHKIPRSGPVIFVAAPHANQVKKARTSPAVQLQRPTEMLHSLLILSLS